MRNFPVAASSKTAPLPVRSFYARSLARADIVARSNLARAGFLQNNSPQEFHKLSDHLEPQIHK